MHVPTHRPHRLPRAAALTLALALSAAAASADQLWVDASAAPGGDGSQGAPYVDIQTAVDHAAGGTAPHTIRVEPGDYAGFTTPAGPFLASVWSTQGPSETRVGPVVALGSGLVLRGLDVDGQGGVGVQTLAGYTIVEFCVVHDAALGIEAQFVSVWNTNVVHCAVGVQAQVDMTDAILFENGVDIDGSAQNFCANIWQSWLDPMGGLTTQSVDPLFWNLEAGDMHVRFGSPAINTGCWTVDIGAFPFSQSYAPQPVVYCTAKAASDGCVAQIGWTGNDGASLSAAGDFTITASDVMPNQNGVLFFQLAPANLPILGGTVCVQPPTTRVGGQNSGSTGAPCSGTFSYDFNAYIQGSPVFPIAPGSWVYAQYWYRDPANSFASALSDAIRFALIH